MKSVVRLTALCAVLAAPTIVLAQAAPAAPAPPPAPLAVPNPTYETLVLEIAVNKPAAEAWAKIGKYCDIEAWLGMKCEMTTGKAGELGSVRTLNGVTIEPLVAKTELSYTYSQPVRQGVPYNQYHGTLEARPVTATTSRLIYSFIWDNSMLDEAAKASTRASRNTRFTAGMAKMKEIVEAQ